MAVGMAGEHQSPVSLCLLGALLQLRYHHRL
jgi:hypothetical protein